MTIDAFLDDLREWAEHHDDVRALAVYGSVARGEVDPYSDVDMVVVLPMAEARDQVSRDFVRQFRPLHGFTKDGKRVWFLDDPFLKVEVTLTTETALEGMRSEFVESRIRDPRRSVLVDKSGRLSEVVQSWLSGDLESTSDPVEREGSSFLYYYHGFHAPFSRGDLFRAFFQYCLAFFKLATLAYVAGGGTDFLYAPRFLFHSLDEERKARLRSASPVFNPLEMRERKELMFDFFLELVIQTGRTDAFPPREMRALREAITSGHPRFHRLRDLGGTGSVQSGMLFRASRLDRYSPAELLDWFDEVGLETLVDLRTDHEMSERGYGYPDEVLEEVTYVRLPVPTNLARSASGARGEPNSMTRFYSELPDEPRFKEALREAVAILADSSKLPVVIHCRGGLDRTGVLSGLILLAIGVDRIAIMDDYLLSGGHTRAEFLERTFEGVDRRGGVEAYMREVGVSTEQLDAMKRNLASPP